MENKIYNKYQSQKLLWPLTGDSLEKQYLHVVLDVTEPFSSYHIKEVNKKSTHDFFSEQDTLLSPPPTGIMEPAEAEIEESQIEDIQDLDTEEDYTEIENPIDDNHNHEAILQEPGKEDIMAFENIIKHYDDTEDVLSEGLGLSEQEEEHNSAEITDSFSEEQIEPIETEDSEALLTEGQDEEVEDFLNDEESYENASEDVLSEGLGLSEQEEEHNSAEITDSFSEEQIEPIETEDSEALLTEGQDEEVEDFLNDEESYENASEDVLSEDLGLSEQEEGYNSAEITDSFSEESAPFVDTLSETKIDLSSPEEENAEPTAIDEQEKILERFSIGDNAALNDEFATDQKEEKEPEIEEKTPINTENTDHSTENLAQHPDMDQAQEKEEEEITGAINEILLEDNSLSLEDQKEEKEPEIEEKTPINTENTDHSTENLAQHPDMDQAQEKEEEEITGAINEILLEDNSLSLEKRLEDNLKRVSELQEQEEQAESLLTQKRKELEALLSEIDGLIAQLPKEEVLEYEKKKNQSLYGHVYDKLGL